jgi:four helix bundle protein
MNSRELCERFLRFGARTYSLASALPRTSLAQHVSVQLFRAATSAGANYSEACGAESKRDFAHKLQIVVKELREAQYWLQLIAAAEMLPAKRMESILREAGELTAICVASSKTANHRVHPPTEAPRRGGV